MLFNQRGIVTITNVLAVAVFILYPLIKLLNPNQQIFLYKGVFHTFLVLVDQETIKLIRLFVDR